VVISLPVLQSIAQLRTPEQLYDRVSCVKDTAAATSDTHARCPLAAVVLVMIRFGRYCPLPSRLPLDNDSIRQPETTTQRESRGVICGRENGLLFPRMGGTCGQAVVSHRKTLEASCSGVKSTQSECAEMHGFAYVFGISGDI